MYLVLVFLSQGVQREKRAVQKTDGIDSEFSANARTLLHESSYKKRGWGRGSNRGTGTESSVLFLFFFFLSQGVDIIMCAVRKRVGDTCACVMFLDACHRVLLYIGRTTL